MSRIGKKPIVIPAGVKVEIDGNHLKVSGPKGVLENDFLDYVSIKQEGNEIHILRKDDSIPSRSQHGLVRSLIDNMVVGVNTGFEKNLEIIGVGYKVEQRDNGIMLSLGHSHQIYFIPPDGIKLLAETPKRKITADGTPNQLLTGTIKITGFDRQLVGQVAAKIRSFRKPDVYKSKGVRYSDERIQLKAGKSAAK